MAGGADAQKRRIQQVAVAQVLLLDPVHERAKLPVAVPQVAAQAALCVREDRLELQATFVDPQGTGDPADGLRPDLLEETGLDRKSVV